MLKRNINQLPTTPTKLGTWLATQARAQTRNQTSNFSVCRKMPNSLSHTSQGKINVFSGYHMVSGDHIPLIPRSKNIYGATLDTTHAGLSSENLGVTSLKKKSSSTSRSSSTPDFHLKGFRIGTTEGQNASTLLDSCFIVLKHPASESLNLRT